MVLMFKKKTLSGIKVIGQQVLFDSLITSLDAHVERWITHSGHVYLIIHC